MPPGAVPSRLALSRYRTRMLVSRLTIGWPRTLELVNLSLALLGAWSVVYQAIKVAFPKGTTGCGLATAGLAAGVVIAIPIWLRLTRRPQDVSAFLSWPTLLHWVSGSCWYTAGEATTPGRSSTTACRPDQRERRGVWATLTEPASRRGFEARVVEAGWSVLPAAPRALGATLTSTTPARVITDSDSR